MPKASTSYSYPSRTYSFIFMLSGRNEPCLRRSTSYSYPSRTYSFTFMLSGRNEPCLRLLHHIRILLVRIALHLCYLGGMNRA